MSSRSSGVQGPRWITTGEFAELSGIGASTIRAWTSTGAHSLPTPYRMGRSLRWKYSEVIAWIEDQKETPWR